MDIRFLAVDPHWRELSNDTQYRSLGFPSAGLSYVIASAKSTGATCVGVEHFFTEKKDRAKSLQEFFTQQTEFINRVISRAVEDKCQVVLITTTTAPYLLLTELIEKFSEFKDIKLVVGGSGVTITNLYENNKNLFFNKPWEHLITVHGEGEVPIKEIFTRLKNGSNDMTGVPGATFVKNGELHSYPGKQANFYDLPPGDYSDFDFTNFFPLLFASHYRGCSGNCTFCDEKDVFHGLRARSTQCFVEELENFVDKYGVRYFKLADSSFTPNENEVIKVCNALIEADLDIGWIAYARINETLKLKDSTLELMKRAKCIGMHFGFETFEKCVLDDVKKGYSGREQAQAIVNKVRKQGMNVIGSFQIGFGASDETSVSESVDFAADLNLDVYNYHAAVPPIKQMEDPKKYNVSSKFRIWNNDLSMPANLFQEYSQWHEEYMGVPATMGRHSPMKQFKDMGMVIPKPSAYNLELSDEFIARELQRAMGGGREKNEALLFLKNA